MLTIFKVVKLKLIVKNEEIQKAGGILTIKLYYYCSIGKIQLLVLHKEFKIYVKLLTKNIFYQLVVAALHPIIYLHGFTPSVVNILIIYVIFFLLLRIKKKS